MNMIPHGLQKFSHQSQQSRDHELVTPSYELSPQSRHSGCPKMTPYRAYPVQRPSSYSQTILDGIFSPITVQCSDTEEHMLRRKTPIGTVAAGYDGAFLDWSTKLPASKHVLLPLSKVFQKNPSRKFSPGARPFYQGQYEGLTNSKVAEEIYFNQQNNISDTMPLWMHDKLGRISASQGYPESMRIQAPSLIPSAYEKHQEQSLMDKTSLSYSTLVENSINSHRITEHELPFDHRHRSPFQVHKNDNQPSVNLMYSPATWPTFINYQAETSEWSSSLSGYIERPFGRDINFSVNTKSYDVVPDLKQNKFTPATPFRNINTFDTQFSTNLGDSWLLQNTLTLASNAYTNLMIFINQHHLEENPQIHINEDDSSLNKQTYPKNQWRHDFKSESLQWQNSHSNKNAFCESHAEKTISLPPTSISNITKRDTQVVQLFPVASNRYYSGQPTEKTPIVPSRAHGSSQNNHVSPLAHAREAMNMLAELCARSGWHWIDGMLLGGCLAHGLEEYHMALEWFSKIISLDSNHVEAMSNLATTLHCLNRHIDAEKYWVKSIEIRPSYFKAIEQLVGLLCCQNRGTEAVTVIEFVERSLQQSHTDYNNFSSSGIASNEKFIPIRLPGEPSKSGPFGINVDKNVIFESLSLQEPDKRKWASPSCSFNNFSIPRLESYQIISLAHAKGNILHALGNVDSAAKAFEEAILISVGHGFRNIRQIIGRILYVLSDENNFFRSSSRTQGIVSPLLLPPEKALQTARLVFVSNGDLPGLSHLSEGPIKRAAVLITSNSLLSLAKIFQDANSNNQSQSRFSGEPFSVRDILALYYLSLSLQPSPSTANNIGILLASIQQTSINCSLTVHQSTIAACSVIPGVTPTSSVAFAVAFYHYGLNLDPNHAHIYTNLGSLLKDVGQLDSAVTMYEKAVACDRFFDIALANLANAVKDQGRTGDAIEYFRRAVASSPNFAEAVCGLANSLNSVCDWVGRGGVQLDNGRKDKWHVDEVGMIIEGKINESGSGWMKRVIDIVKKQLIDGSIWGCGILREHSTLDFLQKLESADSANAWLPEKRTEIYGTLAKWSGGLWEGARIIHLVERGMRRAMHRWYIDKYIMKKFFPPAHYPRPQIPSTLVAPSAPTVLPFHTFTYPLPAKDIRIISQLNALRISCSTLKTPWMRATVFPPPKPPAPHLNVGYVSSDFNNHPLAHLMQSVFGMHDICRVKAFCYATTVSDNSIHRLKIEREAPVFRDASSWSADQIVEKIIEDNIHILVNLNGYTRGARNEIFAARPVPIQMSFMGFAGTLGAEWCDYLLADETVVPPDTLRPRRKNIDLEDQLLNEEFHEDENWVYSENIIFCRDTFFCCDHAQSKTRENRITWHDEQSKRWKMRKEIFPDLSDEAIILGNFNQLYKIEPTTFRTWLRILDKVPQAILWLLRFPGLGETNLKRTALNWAGENVARRILFSDVAPKHQHISRARVCDLFLDTPECNAHTTAADILWSSTPLLTLPRYKYKMCSRMAASILKGALPKNQEGRKAAAELIAKDDDQYENFATELASNFKYQPNQFGYSVGVGRLGELRKLLFDSRWSCALFDTKRWVNDLEIAYGEAWRRWVADEGGDIYLKYLLEERNDYNRK